MAEAATRNTNPLHPSPHLCPCIVRRCKAPQSMSNVLSRGIDGPCDSTILARPKQNLLRIWSSSLQLRREKCVEGRPMHLTAGSHLPIPLRFYTGDSDSTRIHPPMQDTPLCKGETLLLRFFKGWIYSIWEIALSPQDILTKLMKNLTKTI